MLIVETIAKIRRAYFVQGKSIKAICRELRVSRKTVRKVIRSDETEFSYERSFQPQPKIGPWRDELDRLLAANAARPSRERLTLTRIFEELRGLGYDGGYDAVRRYAADWKRQASEATAAAYVPSRGTRASGTTLRPRRGIPVRLEPRGRGDRRRHDDGEGRARPALPQPDDVRAGLSARDARQMVFDAHDKAFAFFGGACTRGIYDSEADQRAVQWTDRPPSEDGGRRDLHGPGARLQPPLPANVRSLPGRTRGLHARLRLGEGTGREPGGRGPAPLLRAPGSGEELRGAQRLAGRPLHGVGGGPPPPRDPGANDPGGVRGGAVEPRALSRSLRRLPCRAGGRLEDLPGSLRQEQVFGLRLGGRAPGGDPGLCRPGRDPPGRPPGRRAPARLRPRPDGLRSLALRARAGPQAGGAEEWRALQGMGPADLA